MNWTIKQAGLAAITAGLLGLSSQTAQAVDPWLEIEGKFGEDRSLGQADAFIPLSYDGDSLVFLDLRTVITDQDTAEGNVGLGYRHMFEDFILGGYVYYDVQESAYNFTYHQLSAGVEVLTPRYEFRINGYLPEADGHYLETLAIYEETAYLKFDDTDLYAAADALVHNEGAFYGGNVEAGVTIFPSDFGSDATNWDLRFLAGYFYFDRHDYDGDVSGPMGRAELRWLNPLGMDGWQVKVGAEGRDDDLRGTEISGTLSLLIPLTDDGRATELPEHGTLASRMSLPVRRDVDILALDYLAIEERTGVVFNPVTGNPMTKGVFFADVADGAGTGTFDDPASLADAAFIGGDDSLIVGIKANTLGNFLESSEFYLGEGAILADGDESAAIWGTLDLDAIIDGFNIIVDNPNIIPIGEPDAQGGAPTIAASADDGTIGWLNDNNWILHQSFDGNGYDSSLLYGIYLENDATFFLSNAWVLGSSFTDITDGAGIALIESSGLYPIVDSSFSDIKADSDVGYGIYVLDTVDQLTLNVSGSTFEMTNAFPNAGIVFDNTIPDTVGQINFNIYDTTFTGEGFGAIGIGVFGGFDSIDGTIGTEEGSSSFANLGYGILFEEVGVELDSQLTISDTSFSTFEFDAIEIDMVSTDDSDLVITIEDSFFELADSALDLDVSDFDEVILNFHDNTLGVDDLVVDFDLSAVHLTFNDVDNVEINMDPNLIYDAAADASGVFVDASGFSTFDFSFTGLDGDLAVIKDVSEGIVLLLDDGGDATVLVDYTEIDGLEYTAINVIADNLDSLDIDLTNSSINDTGSNGLRVVTTDVDTVELNVADTDFTDITDTGIQLDINTPETATLVFNQVGITGTGEAGIEIDIDGTGDWEATIDMDAVTLTDIGTWVESDAINIHAYNESSVGTLNIYMDDITIGDIADDGEDVSGHGIELEIIEVEAGGVWIDGLTTYDIGEDAMHFDLLGGVGVPGPGNSGTPFTVSVIDANLLRTRDEGIELTINDGGGEDWSVDVIIQDSSFTDHDIGTAIGITANIITVNDNELSVDIDDITVDGATNGVILNLAAVDEVEVTLTDFEIEDVFNGVIIDIISAENVEVTVDTDTLDANTIDASLDGFHLKIEGADDGFVSIDDVSISGMSDKGFDLDLDDVDGNGQGFDVSITNVTVDGSDLDDAADHGFFINIGDESDVDITLTGLTVNGTPGAEARAFYIAAFGDSDVDLTIIDMDINGSGWGNAATISMNDLDGGSLTMVGFAAEGFANWGLDITLSNVDDGNGMGQHFDVDIFGVEILGDEVTAGGGLRVTAKDGADVEALIRSALIEGETDTGAGLSLDGIGPDTVFDVTLTDSTIAYWETGIYVYAEDMADGDMNVDIGANGNGNAVTVGTFLDGGIGLEIIAFADDFDSYVDVDLFGAVIVSGTPVNTVGIDLTASEDTGDAYIDLNIGKAGPENTGIAGWDIGVYWDQADPDISVSIDAGTIFLFNNANTDSK